MTINLIKSAIVKLSHKKQVIAQKHWVKAQKTDGYIFNFGTKYHAIISLLLFYHFFQTRLVAKCLECTSLPEVGSGGNGNRKMVVYN